VKVGIYFDLRNPARLGVSGSSLYGATLELCEEAEHLGADSLWLSEHHLFADGYLPQPLVFAAAAAARTKRVRIGTAILLPGLRHPVHIAEEAAVVDLISAGRLDLGFGAGYRPPEYALFDAEFAGRYGVTDERVHQLRAIWSEGVVTPSPVQNPVPIWLGYQGPQGAARAGRLGVGLLSVNPLLVEPYVRGLVEGGHDPRTARMSGLIPGFVTEDPERDWGTVSRHLAYQWDSYLEYRVEGTDQPKPPPVDPEAWRQRGLDLNPRNQGFMFATANEAAGLIRNQLNPVPADTIFFWASIGDMSLDLAAQHIATICTRLRPLLTDK
jgi:alkanesulfonate monooxygenase SsuD/methylene tetrahydromethanopterin reductase-like flavin-dependent oxidoreductase (luciferase family)